LRYDSNGRNRDPWVRDRSRYALQRRQTHSPSMDVGYARGPQPSAPADPWKYWGVIRRQWRFALGIFVVVVAATMIGTLLKTPMYRADGLMEIRRASSDAVPMEALFRGESPSQDYLETQQGLLRSFALGARVVHDLDLHRFEELRPSEDSLPAEAEDLSVAQLQPVVDRLHERLAIGGGTGGRLMRIQFDAEDPELAASVVNSMLDNFVAMRRDGGAEATAWLSEQLGDARDRLEASELDLQDYAQANGLPLARGDEDVAANIQERLDALETDLMNARTERLAAEARQVTLVQEGLSEAVDNPVLEDLTLRIADLQREHARLAATFTDDYPAVQQLSRQIESLQARRAEEQQRLARGITGEYQAALSREELLEQAVVDEKAASDSLMTRAAGYRILRREVEAHRERYAALQEKLMEAEVATAVSGVDVDIVDRAMPPVEPYSPSLPLSAAFALFGGALLAIGGAFVREYLYPTGSTPDDVGAAVDAPVLAVIPAAAPDADRGPERLGAGARARARLREGGARRDTRGRWPRSGGDGARSRSRAISDAMGNLRAAVLFDQGPAAARSILVTSSIPGEGKTTVAVNFAISLAGMGRDVLLVDADMRRPCVHRVLELGAGSGLVQFLERTEDEWPVLVHRDHMPGLDVLVAGGQPASPESLLASTRFAMLLAEAQELYDFVVIDGPALFIDAPDARIMADQVHGVVAVVRGGSSPSSVRRPVLSDVPNLLGVILNDFDPQDVADEEVYEGDEAEVEEEVAGVAAAADDRSDDSG
jgi:polysaccharide biosynthesis transport protein